MDNANVWASLTSRTTLLKRAGRGSSSRRASKACGGSSWMANASQVRRVCCRATKRYARSSCEGNEPSPHGLFTHREPARSSRPSKDVCALVRRARDRGLLDRYRHALDDAGGRVRRKSGVEGAVGGAPSLLGSSRPVHQGG